MIRQGMPEVVSGFFFVVVVLGITRRPPVKSTDC